MTVTIRKSSIAGLMLTCSHSEGLGDVAAGEPARQLVKALADKCRGLVAGRPPLLVRVVYQNGASTWLFVGFATSFEVW
jgi:hypothetical protein